MERAATDGFKKALQPPRSSDRQLLQQNLPGADMPTSPSADRQQPPAD